MKRRGPFKGELARPIKWTGPATLSLGGTIVEPTEEQLQAHQAALSRARKEAFVAALNKLLLLRDHYKIPEQQDWALLLSLALAQEFIPGFRIKYPAIGSGRKRQWDALRYTQLLYDVESLKRERQCGDREACKILAQRSRAAGTRYDYLSKSKTPIDTLTKSIEARLVEARLPKHNVLFAALAGGDPARKQHAIEQLLKIGGPLTAKFEKMVPRE
jgi:hypothetical protein